MLIKGDNASSEQYQKPKIDFMVIGAQKAATTFVTEQLRSHPSVFMPKSEVPFFEDPDYADGDLRRLGASVRAAPPGTLVGIKRPAWIGRPEVPARIASDYPNVRLIAVLRNPIDRAVSAYFHSLRAGTLPVVDVNVGLEKILTKEWDTPAARQVLEYGLYGKYLAMYSRLFPRGQMLVLLQEEIRGSPARQLEKLSRFLGIDRALFSSSTAKVNRGIYSYELLRFVGRMTRLRMRYEPAWNRSYRRSGVIGVIAEYGAGAIIKGINSLVEYGPQGKTPSISGDLKRRIYQLYEDDIRATEQLTGYDLAHWRIE